MNESKVFNDLIKPMEISCSIIACWPRRNKSRLKCHVFLRRFHLFIVIVLISLLIFGGIIELIYFWGINMNETIENVMIACALSIALLRVIIFAKHQKEILCITEIMKKDWMFSTTEDKLILNEKCMLSFKLAKFFVFSVYITTCVFIMPIFKSILFKQEHKRILPFRGYYFYNYTISPVYEYTYFFNSLAGMVACHTISGCTTFSFIIIIHASAKFAMIKKDFESLNVSTWNSKSKIKSLVLRHQKCISFAETIEYAIHMLVLGQCIISTALVCFAGFQITTMVNNRDSFGKNLSFIIAAIMELYIFNYAGECLKQESEDIASHVYSSNWYGSTSSANLRLILMRCTKPCVITAGKFYNMCLISFLKVLSSSYSYLTVLLAMKEE